MYPQDFDCDENVRMMEDCELGMFLRLLNHSWINDGLPSDLESLRRVFRYTKEDFDQRWPIVAKCFEVFPDGRLRNPRQEQERSKAVEKTKQAKDAAASKWKNRQDADAMRTHNGRKADAMPRAYDSDSDIDSDSSLALKKQVSEISTSHSARYHEASEMLDSGYESPEHFEEWWQALVASHPNRNKASVARSRIVEAILARNWSRAAFDGGYARLRAALGVDWEAERGRYCPNLYQIIADEQWKYAPPQKAKTDKERGLAG
jgi:uncharacterized protein YdaU (DUF1376 family)